MCEKKARSEEYSSTREAFDSLNAEEKLTFLAESAAKAVADGIQEVVASFSEAMENGWPGEDGSKEDDSGEEKDQAPEKKKAAPKKPTSKRKTTKKAAPKKTTKKATDTKE